MRERVLALLHVLDLPIWFRQCQVAALVRGYEPQWRTFSTLGVNLAYYAVRTGARPFCQSKDILFRLSRHRCNLVELIILICSK